LQRPLDKIESLRAEEGVTAEIASAV
jgi:hypothetical protein